MKNNFDWLFWIDLKQTNKLLYISQQKNNLKRYLNFNVEIEHKFFLSKEEITFCVNNNMLYDLIFIETLPVDKINSMDYFFNNISAILVNDGKLIVGYSKKNYLFTFIYNKLVRGFYINPKNIEYIDNINYINTLNYDCLEEEKKLYVFPSIAACSTIADNNLILRNLNFWNKNKNIYLLFIRKILNIHVISNALLLMWPHYLVAYRKK